MSRLLVRQRAVALGVAALCAASGCAGDDGPPVGSGTPTASASATVPTPAPSGADAVEARVRALMAPYEKQLGAPTVAFTWEDGHLGVYLKPQPAWDVDDYVAALPVQAAASRAILDAVPEAADADVCVDGHWLPHKGDAAYSTASKVLLYRSRLHRVPADLSTPALVLRASLRDQVFDVYVDPKIQTESAAWQQARKAGQ